MKFNNSPVLSLLEEEFAKSKGVKQKDLFSMLSKREEEIEREKDGKIDRVKARWVFFARACFLY